MNETPRTRKLIRQFGRIMTATAAAMAIFMLMVVITGNALAALVSLMASGAMIFPVAMERRSVRRYRLIHAATVQHAAIMKGNDYFGTYGNYPPARLGPDAASEGDPMSPLWVKKDDTDGSDE